MSKDLRLGATLAVVGLFEVCLFGSCLLVGCRDGAPELSAVPPAGGLEMMSATVQEQYRTRRRTVDRRLAERPVAGGELATAFGELGMWYHHYRLWEGAAAAYGNARRLAPDDRRWSYYLALLDVDSGRPAAARARFGELLETAPEEVPVLVRLGELELAEPELTEDLLDAAEAHLEKALAVDPGCARAMVALATLAGQRGHDEEAVGWLVQALEHQPGASRIRYALGLAYRRLGDLERAEAFLTIAGREAQPEELRMEDPLHRSLRALGASVGSYMRQARKAAKSGQHTAALQYYRSAAEAEPSSLPAYLGIGRSLERLGRIEDALASYSVTLGLFDGDADVHLEIGLLLLAEGRLVEAAESLGAALRARPDDLSVHLALGTLAERRGELEAALEHLAAARSIKPHGMRVCRRHAVMLMRLQRHGEARQALEEDLSVASRPLALLLARLLATASADPARDGQQALRLAAVAFEQRPGLDAAEVVALALAETGRFAAAADLQSQLVAAAQQAGDEALRQRLEDHLARFRGRLPVRDPLPPESTAADVFVDPGVVEGHLEGLIDAE